MRFIGTLAVLAFIIVTLCGCGASVADRNRPPSPFEGFWVGNWTDSTNQQTGTAQVVITKDGKASGTIVNTTLGKEGSVSGTITEHGSTGFVYQYPGERYTASGTLLIGFQVNPPHLVGMLDQYSGDTIFGKVTVDLTKQ